ncbi:hypothetical protein [Chryseobacterium aquaticum]|uniref:Uncharacterized protein n=1 Tax=Chryseobacterium aquaticum subsp. greenlandense TaxID=345663 RepID=A0A101CD06_9FLAO|nr:hypothetical protein [Chryseobacterium aquaticum]KUJ54017.1 hypothetical protein AR686_17675 [Chryseobacterium aquaticum subsp. greenlandense]
MSKLTFNDHLDDMMERLMNEDLSSDQLEIELKRGKALCQIADKKIQDKKVALQFVQAISSGQISEKMIPLVFADDFRKVGKIESQES